jgi:multiple sugar transport system permease protein
VPAIVAVSLFHFFFAWNDFFVPLLYLANKPDLQPLSIAIQQYNALYATQPTLIQAAALMTMAVPVVVFFFAQRAFMRGVVVTGADKRRSRTGPSSRLWPGNGRWACRVTTQAGRGWLRR